jgi:hypothetical protein
MKIRFQILQRGDDRRVPAEVRDWQAVPRKGDLVLLDQWGGAREVAAVRWQDGGAGPDVVVTVR